MSQHLIQSYFHELDNLRRAGADTENQLRPAFEHLLADYARLRNLVFVPEVPMKAANGSNTIRPDGVIKGLNRMDWGYWEAKDEHDNLDDEIRAKIAKGYPTDNIIFDDTRKAVLYQAGLRALEIDLSDKQALQALLERFFTFERPEYTAFREALENFHADVPPIVAELRQLLAQTASTNAAFVSARQKFLDVCQTAINADVSMDDVNEMLLQHILTADIFMTIFEDADFHRANNIARELESVLATFFRGATKLNALARIRPYYEAIRAAAARIADYREKQTFLKAVYEDFYKAYNPKAADRLGVVYTPHEIVRFMVHATDELLHTHFGKDLLASGVEILDPATGTGTFICDLLDYFPAARKEHIRHKYLHELHANEVSILPYYIANLNIEYVFQQKTGEYVEFPNLCFVDTLDNTGFGFTGQQGDMFSLLSAENAARVKRQNERNIAVVIGNPPYNANQQNENDNNKNRSYRDVDKRIKDTYIAASTAQKTKLYDMYARFFRWASDRLAHDGIVAFVCNRSFIESRTFDGFRKCVAEEFQEIWIVDLKGDAHTSGERRRKEGDNIFANKIRVGVAICLLVRNQKLGSKNCRINYVAVEDYTTYEQKLDFIRHNNFHSLPFERITPDQRHTWLNQTDNDFDTLLPLCSKDVKAGKAKTGALFELFSLGISTNRDEWVIDYTPDALAKKMKFFADFYNRYKHSSGDYDTTIKWSRNLKRRYEQGKREPFDAKRIVPVAYRPFANFSLYKSDLFLDEQGQAKEMFAGENQVICVQGGTSNKSFHTLGTNTQFDLHFTGDTFSVPLYRYGNGERRENITAWGLKQFRARYGKQVEREDIFHYVYAVLHCPHYRRKYEQNLKRDFPRVPFYEDFALWAAWGRELMRLHVDYESDEAVEPFALRHTAAAQVQAKSRQGARGNRRGRLHHPHRHSTSGVGLHTRQPLCAGVGLRPVPRLHAQRPNDTRALPHVPLRRTQRAGDCAAAARVPRERRDGGDCGADGGDRAVKER
jgi:predicted helicase